MVVEPDLAAAGVVQVAGDRAGDGLWRRTRSAALSARITSPETVSRVRSPRTPSASIGPEVSFAEVLPRRPIRVIWPAVTLTVVSPAQAGGDQRARDQAQVGEDVGGHGDGDVHPGIAVDHPEPPQDVRPAPTALLADAEPAVGVVDQDRPTADLGHVDPGRPVGGDHVEPSTDQSNVQPDDRSVHGEPLRALDRPSGHGVPLSTTRGRHAEQEEDVTRYIATPQDCRESRRIRAPRSPSILDSSSASRTAETTTTWIEHDLPGPSATAAGGGGGARAAGRRGDRATGARAYLPLGSQIQVAARRGGTRGRRGHRRHRPQPGPRYGTRRGHQVYGRLGGPGQQPSVGVTGRVQRAGDRHRDHQSRAATTRATERSRVSSPRKAAAVVVDPVAAQR